MTAATRVKLRNTQGDTITKAFRFTTPGGRVVFDASMTDSSTTVTSVKARLTSSDEGYPIFGTGITLGTTIDSVSSDGVTLALTDVATETTSGGTLIIRALDVSNYTFEMQLRSSPKATSTLATFAIDTTNAQGGEIIATVDADTSKTLPYVSYWDLQATLNTQVETWLKGQLVLDPDVTRST